MWNQLVLKPVPRCDAVCTHDAEEVVVAGELKVLIEDE